MSRTTNQASSRYRPDIDGLRGWAVILVFIFHLRPEFLTGAFTSLDIFFVISGFLITGNIRHDVTKGKFSFALFYKKRFRRLFPALFATLLLCLATGVFLLTPTHLEQLEKSIIATSLFLANFHFWSLSGYFDAASHYKPLLHTWSLSLEEQYYLIWPVTLFLLLRFGKDKLTITFLIIGIIASIGYAEIFYKSDPEGIYYLLPSRMFEFMCGSLMVWLVPFQFKNKIWQEILVLAGLALIAVPIFLYTKETPFPGLWAIPSILGAALLIHSGTARYLGRILNNPLAVNLGLISYSLYLVHWPLIVFYRFWRISALTAIEQGGLVIAAIALATLMYHFIEKPYRYPKEPEEKKSSKRFITISIAALCCLLALSTQIAASGGWSWRVSNAIEAGIHQNPGTNRHVRREGTCFHLQQSLKNIDDFLLYEEECLVRQPGKKNYLLFGDSHAAQLHYGLKKAFPEHHFLQATLASCPPFIQPLKRKSVLCQEFTHYMFNEYLPRHPEIDTIILATSPRGDNAENWPEVIAYLEFIGHDTILIGGNVMYKAQLPLIMFKYRNLDNIASFAKRYEHEIATGIHKDVKTWAEQNDKKFISLYDLTCPDECQIMYKDAPIIYDRGHYTEQGSEFIARQIKEKTALFD